MANNYVPIPLKDVKPKHTNFNATLSPPSVNHTQFHRGIPSNVGINPAHTVSTGQPSKLRNIITHYSATTENFIETVTKPIKPHLSKLGRFLLVSTFLEDALRFSKQYHHIERYLTQDLGYPHWFSVTFSTLNISIMIICSILIIFKRWSLFSVSSLVLVMVSQGVVYELMTDLSFVCLNFSIFGALLLALSDNLISSCHNTRRTIAGIPNISEDLTRKRSTYLQLIGRLLLVFFFSVQVITSSIHLFKKKFSIYNMTLAILSLVSCLLVSIGFKARWSALILVLVISLVNVTKNNWWSNSDSIEKDFRRFDFFQALSIIGGMILLINQGPGGISFDARRKTI